MHFFFSKTSSTSNRISKEYEYSVDSIIHKEIDLTTNATINHLEIKTMITEPNSHADIDNTLLQLYHLRQGIFPRRENREKVRNQITDYFSIFLCPMKRLLLNDIPLFIARKMDKILKNHNTKSSIDLDLLRILFVELFLNMNVIIAILQWPNYHRNFYNFSNLFKKVFNMLYRHSELQKEITDVIYKISIDQSNFSLKSLLNSTEYTNVFAMLIPIYRFRKEVMGIHADSSMKFSWRNPLLISIDFWRIADVHFLIDICQMNSGCEYNGGNENASGSRNNDKNHEFLVNRNNDKNNGSNEDEGNRFSSIDLSENPSSNNTIYLQSILTTGILQTISTTLIFRLQSNHPSNIPFSKHPVPWPTHYVIPHLKLLFKILKITKFSSVDFTINQLIDQLIFPYFNKHFPTEFNQFDRLCHDHELKQSRSSTDGVLDLEIVNILLDLLVLIIEETPHFLQCVINPSRLDLLTILIFNIWCVCHSEGGIDWFSFSYRQVDVIEGSSSNKDSSLKNIDSKIYRLVYNIFILEPPFFVKNLPNGYSLINLISHSINQFQEFSEGKRDKNEPMLFYNVSLSIDNITSMFGLFAYVLSQNYYRECHKDDLFKGIFELFNRLGQICIDYDLDMEKFQSGIMQFLSAELKALLIEQYIQYLSKDLVTTSEEFREQSSLPTSNDVNNTTDEQNTCFNYLLHFSLMATLCSSLENRGLLTIPKIKVILTIWSNFLYNINHSENTTSFTIFAIKCIFQNYFYHRNSIFTRNYLIFLLPKFAPILIQDMAILYSKIFDELSEDLVGSSSLGHENFIGLILYHSVVFSRDIYTKTRDISYDREIVEYSIDNHLVQDENQIESILSEVSFLSDSLNRFLSSKFSSTQGILTDENNNSLFTFPIYTYELILNYESNATSTSFQLDNLFQSVCDDYSTYISMKRNNTNNIEIKNILTSIYNRLFLLIKYMRNVNIPFKSIDLAGILDILRTIPLCSTVNDYICLPILRPSDIYTGDDTYYPLYLAEYNVDIILQLHLAFHEYLVNALSNCRDFSNDDLSQELMLSSLNILLDDASKIFLNGDNLKRGISLILSKDSFRLKNEIIAHFLKKYREASIRSSDCILKDKHKYLPIYDGMLFDYYTNYTDGATSSLMTTLKPKTRNGLFRRIKHSHIVYFEEKVSKTITCEQCTNALYEAKFALSILDDYLDTNVDGPLQFTTNSFFSSPTAAMLIDVLFRYKLSSIYFEPIVARNTLDKIHYIDHIWYQESNSNFKSYFIFSKLSFSGGENDEKTFTNLHFHILSKIFKIYYYSVNPNIGMKTCFKILNVLEGKLQDNSTQLLLGEREDNLIDGISDSFHLPSGEMNSKLGWSIDYNFILSLWRFLIGLFCDLMRNRNKFNDTREYNDKMNTESSDDFLMKFVSNESNIYSQITNLILSILTDVASFCLPSICGVSNEFGILVIIDELIEQIRVDIYGFKLFIENEMDGELKSLGEKIISSEIVKTFM